MQVALRGGSGGISVGTVGVVDRIREQLIARSPTIMAGIDRTQHGPAGAALSALRKLVELAEGHEELAVPNTPRRLPRPMAAIRRRQPLDRLPRTVSHRTCRLDVTEGKLAAAYDQIHAP